MEMSKSETLREIEHLTRGEINALKKRVLGYGNFKKMAIQVDMPATTLRDVINKEYGEPATIGKIRRVLNQGQDVENGTAKVVAYK